MMWKSIFLILIVIVVGINSSHFRGAVIQWRPINPQNFDGRIEISHRIAWRRSWRSTTMCETRDIGTTRLFGFDSLTCRSGCSGSFSLQFYCTDFSTTEDWVSGSYSRTYNIGSSASNFEASYESCCWISLNSGGSSWEVRVKGTLTPRPDNSRINTSPVTSITPIVRLRQGCNHRISIPHQDADQDDVRCRWAVGNECAGVCGALSGSVLSQDCVLTYSATGNLGWYAVAIQMEDFISTTSTTPMSSVPIQFLINVFSDGLSCIVNTSPELIPGETPLDQSCIPVPAGGTYRAGIVAFSGGSSLSVTSFITTSPVGLTRSAVTQSSFNSTLYYVNVTWTPSASQVGTLQVFCFQAQNNIGLQSNQSCVYFIGGSTGPVALQSSVFPIGTIFPSASTVWSVTFDQAIRRPIADRYIRIYDQSTGQMVYRLNTRTTAASFPGNGTSGRMLTFTVNFNFVPARRYYILLDSGVAAGTLYCFQESPSVTNTTFWNFLINCPVGYNLIGNSCRDINECSTGNYVCSIANTTCSNTVGSYTCICNPGYELQSNMCQDIDECARGTHACSSLAMCSNNLGSYTCACSSGTIGDGFTCSDACDECLGVPANCGTHNCNISTSDCTNTIGSFQCTCRFGLDSGGINCAPPPRPDPPRSVSIQQVTATSITITWMPPAASIGNNIASYLLLLSDELTGSITNYTISSTTYTLSGLEEYRNYSCQLRSISRYGPISLLTSAVFTTTLEAVPSAPPQNFNGSPSSPTSAIITWNPPPIDDQNGVIINYIINVTVVGTGATFQLTSTTTTLSVSSLSPFTTFICIIAAVTNVGIGPFSNQFALSTPEDAPYSPPQSVSLSPVNSRSVNITWSPPPTNSINGVIREYRINITEVITGRIIYLTSTTTSITAVGLHPYYLYECVISAVTVAVGPYSQTINITTPEDVPSGSPQNFNASASSSRSATISWNPPHAEEQNGIIVNYLINVTVVGSGQTFQLSSTTTFLTVSTLLPYRTYLCIIAAVTSVGVGPYSTQFTLTTPQDVPTMAPQTPSSVTRSSRTIYCTWTPPSLDHQNGVIIEYRVNITEVITGRSFVRVTTNTFIEISSLHPDYEYQWIVTAVTVGIGPYTTAVIIRTLEDVPSSAPTLFSGNAVTARSIFVSWQTIPQEDQNGIILGYLVNITSLDTGLTQQLTSTSTNITITGLAPFTVYICIVAATTAVGPGPFSTTITIQTPETAPDGNPSNFTGISLNSTHIYLTWDPPPADQVNGIIRGYQLNVTEAATGQVLQYVVNTTQITIGSLHPFYIYHCSVVAFTVDTGLNTSFFTVRTAEDIPAGPPTSFYANSTNSRTILLLWNPPAVDERNGIIRYYIVTVISTFSTMVQNVSSNRFSVEVANLRPNTAYACAVSAVTIGTGPNTSTQYVVTLEDVPSGPPQNVTVASNGSRTFVLNWAHPLPSDINGIIVNYTINVTTVGSVVSILQTGSNATEYIVGSLKPYVAYTCEIAAHTSVGQGPFSSGVTLTTPEDVPGAPPVMLSYANLQSRSVEFSWSVPRADQQNGVIRYYRIEAYENDTTNTLTYQTPSSQSRFVVNNLHPYYEYTVRVSAVTVGPGPLSAPITINTPQDVPTASPQNPSGMPLTSTLIRLDWLPPPPEHINGIIIFYLVEVDEVVTNRSWTFHAVQTHIIIGPLHPYYTYRCRVAATTIGMGPFTSFFLVNAGETTPTGSPQNLAASHITATSLSLSWNPPRFDQQNGLIRYYVVTVMDLTSATSRTLTVNATSMVISNLQPYFVYNVSVAAFTIGLGPKSIQLMIQLPQAPPSVAPTGLSGLAINHTSISLQWIAPPSTTFNGVFTAYIVSVTERETGYTFEHNTTKTSILLTSLHPDYVYECRVAAFTVAVGPFSQIFAVQVLMSAPSGAPSNITVTPLTSTSVLLDWDLPLLQHRNGPILAYNLTVENAITGSIHQSSIVMSRTITINGLQPYTSYNFTLSARTSVGYGPTDTVTEMTFEDVPGAPANISVSTVSGDPYSMYISWMKPLVPNGDITSYNVYCLETNTSSVQQALSSSLELFSETVLGVSFNSTVGGLTPFTTYGCFVSANTSIGEGNFSKIEFQMTDEYIPQDPPTNIQASVTSSTSVSLSYSPPLVTYGYIVSYSILVTKLNLSNTTSSSLTANSSGYFIVENLSPYTYYNISIAASTRIGTGPYDTTITRTLQDRPSGTPLSVTISVPGSTTANISWLPPDITMQNGPIVVYTVILSDITFNMPDRVFNTSLSYQFVNALEEYAQYNVSVAAATVEGLGPYTTSMTFTTLEDVPTAPPQNISGQALSSSLIMIYWSPPPPLEVNGRIRHYTVIAVERHTGRQWTFLAIDADLHVGSLHPYYYYDFNVSANTIGPGPFSDAFSVLTDPEPPIAAPEQLSVSMTSTSFTVTWNPPPFEDTNGPIQYYTVQVTEVDTGQQFVPRSTSATQITFINLHPHYTYEFAVAAYTIGIGPYTVPINIQLDPEAPTGSPLGLNGYPRDPRSISLSWDPPLYSDRNGMILHYLVNVTELNSGKTFDHVSVRTNFTLLGLHPFYNYSVTTTAVTVGPGPPTAPFIITTDQDAPSGPIRNLNASVISHEEASITWREPNEEDQNGIITSYVINVTHSVTRITFQRTSTTTSLYLDTLKPFTAYTCQVAARTTAGLGPFSTSISFLTEQTRPYDSPEITNITTPTSRSIRLQWNPPSMATSNGIITEYRINITELDTGIEMALTSFTTEFTVQGLHPNYFYECSVSAHTVSLGPYSAPLLIQTPEDVPSGCPQMFMETVESSQSINFTWATPQLEDQNGVIVSYTIIISEALTGGIAFSRTVPSSQISITVVNLLPYTTYLCSIAASTIIGTGPFCQNLTVTTLQDGPSMPPSNLSATVLDSKTVSLSWNEPRGRRNGIIQEYRINFTEMDTDRKFQIISFPTTLTLNNLHPDYTYTWIISAFTVAEGPYSGALNFTTPEDVPTGAPVNITSAPVSPTAFTLNWEQPLPEERNGDIVGYSINVTNLNTEVVQQFTVGLVSNYTVYNLKPFTVYTTSISARTAIGLGPYSGLVTVTTLEDAPGSQPLNFSGFALNSTHIFLDWSPPDPNTVNGVIREYRINVTEGETGTLFQFTTIPNITEATIGVFHPFYTYHCTILAYTVEGGPNTSVISVRTNEAAPSGSPTNVMAVTTSPRSISLMWSPPPTNQLNGILRHFFIVLVTEVGMVTRNVSSVQQSTIISGLTPYLQYNCTIQAETIALGPASDVVVVYTPEDAPSGPPQNVYLQSVNATTLIISWAPPLINHRNGLILRYRIRVNELDTGTILQFNTTNLNVTIGDLHPHYRYSCSVAAETIPGVGPFSVAETLQLPQAAPASAPVTVQVSNIASTEFTVTWLPPRGEDHNGVIQEYLLDVREENTGREFSLTSTTTSQRIDGQIHPYYNYTILVSAVTISAGSSSSPVTITTLQDVPSGSPQNLQTAAHSSTEVLVAWGAPRVMDSNGIITSYTLMIIFEGNTSFLSTSDHYLTISDLQPYSSYMFRIAASTIIGRGPFSTSTTITTPEDAPEGAPLNVTSSSVTSSSLILSWNPPVNALQNGIIRHYIITAMELNTGANFTYMTQSRTIISVGDLHPYYTYQFNVYAVTVQAGPPSLDHQVTTLQDVPSVPPSEITEIPLTPTILQIIWSPLPLESQNGIITNYFINISVTETNDRLHFTTPGNVTSLNISYLHPHYIYHYIIAAGTDPGMGPFSLSRSIRMPEDAPAGVPLNQLGSAVNSTAIIFTWDHPAIDARNGIITGYSLLLIELITNSTTLYNQTGAHIELVIGNLHPYYDYECQIAAETSAGRGPYSMPFITRTLQDVPTGVPLDVRVTVIDSRTLAVMWEPPLNNLQNGIIQNYTVAVLVQQTSTSLTLNTMELSLTIPNLHPAYDHSIRVAAVTIGTGPYSTPVMITTPDDTPTGPPLMVIAVSVSSTSIRISWQAPLQELQNGAITSYYITVVERETGNVLNFTTVPTDSIYVVNGLHPFYFYNCSVAAYTNGLGPSSSFVVQTLPEEPSVSPQNVTATPTNASTVLVSWVPPPPEERNGIIQGFTVRIVGVNTEEDFTRSINATKIIIGSLHPFYSYRVTVATVTISHGPFSNPLTFKMPPLAPTAPVENITVIAISPTDIQVRWLPPHPNFWNGIVSRYTIEYTLLRPATSEEEDYDDDESQQNFAAMQYIAYSPSNSHPLQNNPNPTLATTPLVWEELEIAGLLEYFVYSFSIFYENEAGRSDDSVAVEQETPSAAPSGPPTNVLVTSQSESSIVVQWNPPELFERNGMIIGYQVNLTYTNSSYKTYSVSGFTFNLQIEGLPKFTELNISVAAKTSVGLGPASSSVKVKTREDVPGQPKELKTIQVDKHTIELSWSPPDSPNGNLIEYRIVYFGYKQVESTPVKREADIVILDGPHIIVVSYLQTSVVIKDLEAGLTYTLIVGARTSPGYGSNSTITVEVSDVEFATSSLASSKSGISTSTALIIVAVVGWALLMIGLVAVITVYIWRKKRRQYLFKSRSAGGARPQPVVQTNFYETSPGGVEMNESAYDDIQNVMSNSAAISSELEKNPKWEFSSDDSSEEPKKLDLIQEIEDDLDKLKLEKNGGDDTKDITYL